LVVKVEQMTDDETTAARTVGEALVLLRHRAHMSRDQVAVSAQVATGTLSRYENDLTLKPDVIALRRIARTLAEQTGDTEEKVWHDIGALIDRMHLIARLDAASRVPRRDAD
jgi:transcriptional regulator with XRE-family HTH domain